jgi:tetratricopeptide (TPR) repeat protein
LIRSSRILVFCLPAVAALAGEALSDGTRALYRGDYRQAAAIASAYAAEHSQDADSRVLLARAEMAQGHVDAAYVALAEAVRLQPRHVDALFFLSTLAKVMARQQYDRLYRIAPDSARVHQVMGESYVSQGDLPQAEAEYKTAIRMNPRLLAPLVGLADLKRENGAFQEAMPYYARALEANPSSFDANYGMGVCLVYLRRTEEALPYFRSALAVEESSAVARFA